MADVSDVVSGTERSVRVDGPGDETRARNAAEAVAEDVGFDESERADLGHVAVELASNLVDYATDGTLTVQQVESDEETGIRIATTDSGPGIPSADAAFGVGESTGDSLGYGLATVNQLMDTVEITPREPGGKGTRVVAERWRRAPYTTSVPRKYAIGVATRSISRDLPNGDAFVVKNWNDRTLVGVIDGLGHGPGAHEAATRARNYVESHFDRPLASVFRGTERACKGTRGVVMALARFDWSEETVTVANVGNIAIKVTGPDRSGFVLRRGVVGGNAPEPAVVTETWKPQYTMVLHSDGVGTRWSWDEVLAREDQSASGTANWLLEEHGKEDDDATVVAVTEGTDG